MVQKELKHALTRPQLAALLICHTHAPDAVQTTEPSTVCLQVLQLFCWNSCRMLIFQQSLVHGSGFERAQGHSLAQSFFIENIFLVVVWLRMLALPSDLLSDIAIITATLVTAVVGNEHLCTSHLPPGFLFATQQEPFKSIAQLASKVVLKGFAPVGGLAWAAVPPPSSCAALLGFWEAVGWWLTSLTMIVREVVCRMLFWRASAKQSRARGSHVGPRAKWPFDNASVVADILSMLGVSCLAFALLLGCVLWFSAREELPAGLAGA